jgi:hypothetical protein
MCFAVYAEAVPEREVVPQDVMVWNRVNMDMVSKMEDDLAMWCKERISNHCPISNISTFLSLDRSMIFYGIGFRNIDDVSVIYIIDTGDQGSIAGKAWVSDFNHPIRRRLPFNAIKEGNI